MTDSYSLPGALSRATLVQGGRVVEAPPPETPPEGSPEPTGGALDHLWGALQSDPDFIEQSIRGTKAELDSFQPRMGGTPEGEPHQAASFDNSEGDGMYKVAPEHRTAIAEVAKSVDLQPKDLLAVINFESGGTFSPAAKNPGSTATGLIQFMAATATDLGTTTDKLKVMSVPQQLEYVKRYFEPYKGKLKTLGDVYMAVLLPSAIGKPGDHILWRDVPRYDKDGKRIDAYWKNRGLDEDGKGSITKDEAVKAVLDRAKRAGEYS